VQLNKNLCLLAIGGKDRERERERVGEREKTGKEREATIAKHLTTYTYAIMKLP